MKRPEPISVRDSVRTYILDPSIVDDATMAPMAHAATRAAQCMISSSRQREQRAESVSTCCVSKEWSGCSAGMELHVRLVMEPEEHVEVPCAKAEK